MIAELFFFNGRLRSHACVLSPLNTVHTHMYIALSCMGWRLCEARLLVLVRTAYFAESSCTMYSYNEERERESYGLQLVLDSAWGCGE